MIAFPEMELVSAQLQPGGSSTFAYHLTRRFCRGILVALGTNCVLGSWPVSVSSNPRDCSFSIVVANLARCIPSSAAPSTTS